MLKTSKVLVALGVVAGLGVAALPLSSYAAIADDSKESTVQLEIEESLTLDLVGTTAGSADVDFGKISLDADPVDKDLTATVKTNSASGYKLTLQDKDTDNALVNTTDNTKTIDAGTPAKGVSAWGFKTGTITTAGTNSAAAFTGYTEVPTSDGTAAVIVNSDGPSKVDATTPANNGDTAVITFGVSASSAQAAGTYNDIVVVTASANV